MSGRRTVLEQQPKTVLTLPACFAEKRAAIGPQWLRVVFKPKATTAKDDRKNQFIIEEAGDMHAQICGPLHQAVCMRKHDLQS